jgi:hypothetical protein
MMVSVITVLKKEDENYFFFACTKYSEIRIDLFLSISKLSQFINRSVFVLFSSPCQRQSELLPSLGVCRPLTFHILIFSSETA